MNKCEVQIVKYQRLHDMVVEGKRCVRSVLVKRGVTCHKRPVTWHSSHVAAMGL